MKQVIIFAFCAFLTLGAVADHHKSGMFKRIDLDGDGSISVEEHEAAIARMVEKRQALFKAMDVDGDGMVTKAEAKAKMEERRSKRTEGHVHPDRAD
ncbi:MAG: EF-hand domain-containing protein [Porticoccaceae bacterium]|jgi:hypothetical protein|nr:EF-hand domain-containing protein [Porticoccaceae bacterium]MBT5577956.1 EF-hand domain-containing protein [Porticoccaceae bacterium]MBT7376193.1 EF-hand domain-containing protein [Porticoccaceae bacterium]